MLRAHRIELRPTASQAAYLRRCVGTMRFVYNALVSKWKAGEKYSRKEFQKFCINLRQSTPWMRTIGSRATYEAADGFHVAAMNFFKACKKGGKLQKKPPTFKKKGVRDSFRLSHSTQFSVQDRSLRVQGLPEQIRMREFIRFTGTVKSVSIKQHAGKWFASFCVQLAEEQPVENITAQKPRAGSVGVDFGLSVLAALSTGELIENPKPLRRSLKLLKRRQRQASRKYVRGARQSQRHGVAVTRVARIYAKVKNQRSAAQHALTSSLVKRFDRIVIEDLAVSNMAKNRKLSRAVMDAGWASLRWQLTYKCEAAGVQLVVADRFFASSQTCSCCGYRLAVNLTFKQRTFNCPSCESSLDRDINAARNLAAYQPKTILTPPNRGSRKTCALDLRKTFPQGEAGLLEGANINQTINMEGLC